MVSFPVEWHVIDGNRVDVYNAKEAEQVLTAYVEAAARAGVEVPAGPER